MTAAATFSAPFIGRCPARSDPPRVVADAQPTSWPAFWSAVRGRLREAGYRKGTLRLYRQVLRGLRGFLLRQRSAAGPFDLTPDDAEAYLADLAARDVSWSWMASVVTVLRTVFDKLHGMHVAARMVTPRRTWPLPDALSERELRLLLQAVTSPRDRLLVALLSGCGLRVSEACALRWRDFDPHAGTLRVTDPEGLRSRTLSVPVGLRPLFAGLRALSPHDAPILPGALRPPGPAVDSRCRPPNPPAVPSPLGVRQAERIVKTAALRAGIFKPVTPMMLRHTCALRRVLAGHNVRELQVFLGHSSVATTLRYLRCIPPTTPSPADPIRPAAAPAPASGRPSPMAEPPAASVPVHPQPDTVRAQTTLPSALALAIRALRRAVGAHQACGPPI